MERVGIYSRGEDQFDSKGTIVESIERNNRKLIRVKIDEREEGSPLEDGFLFSYPLGKIYIQYPNKEGYERFEFVDTSLKLDKEGGLVFRDTPITDAEIDEEIYSIIEAKLQKAVKTYIAHGNDKNARTIIADSIDTVWPTLDKEIVVYRGQLNTNEIKTVPAPPRYFFSTSSSPEVSTRESFFSHEEKCCLFIIHVQPGVKYYNIGNDATMLEAEILIEGNGTFYQDKQRSSTGFRRLTLGDLINRIGDVRADDLEGEQKALVNVYIQHFYPNRFNIPAGEDEIEEYQEILDSLKTLDNSELQRTIGVFEAYYFPPTREGGRKRRKTYRNKKNRRRHTRKRT
jgi:hypothetical protein